MLVFGLIFFSCCMFLIEVVFVFIVFLRRIFVVGVFVFVMNKSVGIVFLEVLLFVIFLVNDCRSVKSCLMLVVFCFVMEDVILLI